MSNIVRIFWILKTINKTNLWFRIVKNNMKNKKRVIKIFWIFIVPLILSGIIREDYHQTYEFVDEDSSRMVAPTAPYPYLSNLFSDLLLQIGVSPYSFCIENNAYSKEYSLPHDLIVKLEGSPESIKIHYKEKRCIPILKEDVFYNVMWGGFVIPNKEWAQNHFECNGEKCSLSLKIDEIVNFNVFSKLSFFALVIVYILLVAAFFGFIKFIISLFNFIKK